MSFVFNWPRFSDQFHYDAIQMLNNALNKGNKPPVIADKIEVVELEMGTQPPELDVREIGELTMDQFRGIFRLTYTGDAHLVLKTKVQANPLNHKAPDIHHLTGSAGMLAAKQPLVVPMLLRLSHFELASIVVLVVSKQKGITLVFKTDPLKRVDINSTFDSIAVIQSFIQKEIENQLKQMFREDLPGIIHRLSQTWVKSKVETPYLTKQPSYPRSRRQMDTASLPPMSNPSLGIPSSRNRLPQNPGYSTSTVAPSLRTDARRSVASLPISPTQIPDALDTSPPTFPDIEAYDPTYGLRPGGVPSKSPFRNFGALFQPNKGLVDLTEAEEPLEEELDYDDDDEASTSASFDLVDWDNPQSRTEASPPVESPSDLVQPPAYEYEQIPAVGGGVVTRPRIIHSQSVGPTPATSPLSPQPSATPFPTELFEKRTPLHRSSSLAQLPVRGPMLRTPTVHRNSYFSTSVGVNSWSAPHLRPSSRSSPVYDPTDSATREDTESSLETPPSFTRTTSTAPKTTHSAATTPPQSPESTPALDRRRRSSVSSAAQSDTFESNSRKITLRPSMLTLNHSIHQLSTLSNSNHTLSPYTRSLEHFTVRSGPPRPVKLSKHGMQLPIKAKRKRTYQLGGQRQKSTPPPLALDDRNNLDYYSDSSIPRSPVPPSEFDAMDMAHYFRTAGSPNPQTIRRRK